MPSLRRDEGARSQGFFSHGFPDEEVVDSEILTIGLRCKGYTHTEMLDWPASQRQRHLTWVQELADKEKEELEKLKPKSARRR